MQYFYLLRTEYLPRLPYPTHGQPMLANVQGDLQVYTFVADKLYIYISLSLARN